MDEYYDIKDVLNGEKFNKQIIRKIIGFINEADKKENSDFKYLISITSPVVKKMEIPSVISEVTVLPETTDFKPLVLSLDDENENTVLPSPFNVGSRYGNFGRFKNYDSSKKRYVFKTARGQMKYISQDDEKLIEAVQGFIGTAEAITKRTFR